MHLLEVERNAGDNPVVDVETRKQKVAAGYARESCELLRRAERRCQDSRVEDDVGREEAATESGHERVEHAVEGEEDPDQASEEEDEEEGVQIGAHRAKVVLALRLGGGGDF